LEYLAKIDSDFFTRGFCDRDGNTLARDLNGNYQPELARGLDRWGLRQTSKERKLAKRDSADCHNIRRLEKSSTKRFLKSL